MPFRFDAEPKSVRADLSRSVLLIIDMQDDFLGVDGWFATFRKADVSSLSAVIRQINALSGAFRDAAAPIIYVNWAVRSDVANLSANVLDKGSDCGSRPGYGDQIGSGRVLVEDDWGA